MPMVRTGLSNALPSTTRLSVAEEIRLWLIDELEIARTIPDGTVRRVTASEAFAGPPLKDCKPALRSRATAVVRKEATLRGSIREGPCRAGRRRNAARNDT